MKRVVKWTVCFGVSVIAYPAMNNVISTFLSSPVNSPVFLCPLLQQQAVEALCFTVVRPAVLSCVFILLTSISRDAITLCSGRIVMKLGTNVHRVIEHC